MKLLAKGNIQSGP